MAEIGITTSIVGVAGAGFRLSLVLNAVGCEVASAGVEIHSISRSVSLFSLMLKQVGATLQESDSIHSAEAVDTAKEITEQCQLVFDELKDMLDKVQRKDDHDTAANGPSIPQRFKWCFKKQRVTYLLAQLESLKLSLIVMMQILQLGKLMATTRGRIDPAMKADLITQERAEIQNMVVVRYWCINRLDRLFDLAEHEAEEEKDGHHSETSPGENYSPETPPEYRPSQSKALIKLPIVSLGELDKSMSAIRESPREMLRVSGEVIDPLLNRWTRLSYLQEQEKRGFYSHSNGHGHAGSQTVYEFYETESDESNDSATDVHVKGYYLEGTTTDWRQPHSIDARRERNRLRNTYSSFQPTVDSDSDDSDVKSRSRPKKYRPPTRHVIDSSDDSDAEDPNMIPKRRSSDGSRLDKSTSNASSKDSTRPKSFTPDTRAFSDKYIASPRISVKSSFLPPRPPLPTPPPPPSNQNHHPNQGRPYLKHSTSSPVAPHLSASRPPGVPPSPNRTPYGSPYSTFNALNPLPPCSPSYQANYRNQAAPAPGLLQPQQSPLIHQAQLPAQQLQSHRQFQHPRNLPEAPALTIPTGARAMSEVHSVRPGSRHSASSVSPRESRDYFRDERDRHSDRERDRESHRSSREMRNAAADFREKQKKDAKKNVTKGILGGVGIATFLEALEGLSL